MKCLNRSRVPRRPRGTFLGLAIGACLVSIARGEAGEVAQSPPTEIARFFAPPKELAGDFGSYRSPLVFDDGRIVQDGNDWQARRKEILKAWHEQMGTQPPPIVQPRFETLRSEQKEGYTQRAIAVEVAPDRTTPGYLLVPDGRGKGPFPAVLVVFYEPETAIGVGGKSNRDFARRLVQRGFVCLSIGFDPRVIDPARSGIRIQPLSYLAYVAANAYTAMARLPVIDPKRVAVMGHSYGGKWAMFAACLDERFACGVWSDPGAAFDEKRPSVNYWEPWYLGWEPGRTRKPGLITPQNPRTGAYEKLVEKRHDLHEFQCLMAPRPFLVSGGSEDGINRWQSLNHVLKVNDLLGAKNRVAMTNRPLHDPNPESNEQIDRFLEFTLHPPPITNSK